MPLKVEDVAIDTHSIGERWDINDIKELSKIIAIVLMGQATHAGEILKNLAPKKIQPKITHHTIIKEAQKKLTVTEEATVYHRDGLLFEVISWIAAHHKNPKAIIKLPHLSSTYQGIDGLILTRDAACKKIQSAIICEDKCSTDPRKMFRDEILATFTSYHLGERNTELLNEATTLVKTTGRSASNAVKMAQIIFDKSLARYRASLAVETKHDSQKSRAKLFKDFEKLDNISQAQRIGASLVVDDDLRSYFESLASHALAELNQLEQGAKNV